MRILLINNLYGARAKGGAERVVESEANFLAALGHVVAVLSVGPKPSSTVRGGVCRPEGPGGEAVVTQVNHLEIVPPNIYLYGDGREHGALAKLWWHLRDIFNTASAEQVGAVVRAFSPDVVHTHNLMGFGFLVPRALRRLGVRHVHTVHDVQLVDPSGQIISCPERSEAESKGRPSTAVAASARGRTSVAILLMLLARFLHARLLAVVFGSPETVVFPSEFMRRFHERRGFFRKSRRVVVPNAAPVPSVAERTAPEPKVFLFVGQLEPHKGVALLLDAWREAKMPNVVLELVGDGSMRNVVEQAAARDAFIVYSGKQSGAALDAAYARASFVVVPSLVIENSPTVILEAFAAGTPAVAARQGGIPELVKEGESGFLVAAGDKDALVATLRRAAGIGGDDWQRMSRAAQNVVTSRQSSVVFKKLMGILEKSELKR